MRRTFSLLVAATALMSIAVAGQAPPVVNLPASPRGSAAVQLGGTWVGEGDDRRYTNGSWITVDYGRPILRGRENIFGSGAAYGKAVNPDAPLWRAGANDTTRLTTQRPLAIGGKVLPPGTYNLLIDLKENAWTLVVSTQPVQPKYDPNDKVLLFGAYNYDPKFDVVRAPMRVSTTSMAIEQLTIGFADVRDREGLLYLAWDRTMATVPFEVR